jgi:hypothetical protein
MGGIGSGRKAKPVLKCPKGCSKEFTATEINRGALQKHLLACPKRKGK